jgi:hypothetical protein
MGAYRTLAEQSRKNAEEFDSKANNHKGMTEEASYRFWAKFAREQAAMYDAEADEKGEK